MADVQIKTRNSIALKTEDGCEISIPVEEFDESGFYSGNDQVVDESDSGGVVPCESYLLVSGLRAQLQVASEKNSWLQKRIQDLEEERDFLRCQLDRFIFTTQGRVRNDAGAVQKTVLRKTDPTPPTRTTRRHKPSSKHDEEEDNPHEEDVWLEEEQTDEVAEESDVDGSWRSRASKVRRRRVLRDRQRVKDPAGVLLRYQKILLTYQKVKNMSRAFQLHAVDRNTVASTTPIAELLLVVPEKLVEVGEFDSSKEKLLDYARRCYRVLGEAEHAKVQALKKDDLLLPIAFRFRHALE